MQLNWKQGLLAMLMCTTLTGHALAADDPAEVKARLQKVYMEFLSDEGYRPEIDKDGDVQFKREGSSYFIQVDEADPEFFRLVYPNFWSIESDAERAKALAAIEAANADTKVCKIFTQKDNLWASIEAFQGQPSDFKPVFSRMMSALRSCSSSFARNMRQ